MHYNLYRLISPIFRAQNNFLADLNKFTGRFYNQFRFVLQYDRTCYCTYVMREHRRGILQSVYTSLNLPKLVFPTGIMIFLSGVSPFYSYIFKLSVAVST